MKLIESTVHQFIQQVSSSSPAPGGGSVAALQGACGIGLFQMTIELTISKKKFKQLDSSIQELFHTIHQELPHMLHQMMSFIDEDTEAFNLIMSAFSMPKTTETEVLLRSKAIVQGTKVAINVPKKVIQLALSSAQLLEQVFPYINQNTLSDQGVAFQCLTSAIEGASYNMLINLPSLDEELEKDALKEEALSYIQEANRLRSKYAQEVLSKL